MGGIESKSYLDKQICKLREKGFTYRQIAEAANCSVGKVCTCLAKHKLVGKKSSKVQKISGNGRLCRKCNKDTKGGWWWCPACHKAICHKRDLFEDTEQEIMT